MVIKREGKGDSWYSHVATDWGGPLTETWNEEKVLNLKKREDNFSLNILLINSRCTYRHSDHINSLNLGLMLMKFDLKILYIFVKIILILLSY